MAVVLDEDVCEIECVGCREATEREQRYKKQQLVGDISCKSRENLEENRKEGQRRESGQWSGRADE